jgi:signal transduction histidine kinase
MKRAQLSDFVGATLLLLGVTVIVAWQLQAAPVVQVLSGLPPMVMNTAICFALSGCALLVPRFPEGRYTIITSAIGCALVVLTLLIIAEHATQTTFGIDWASDQIWLVDAKRGQMSVASAIDFLLAGGVFLLLTRVDRHWVGTLVRLMVLGVGTIGVLGLSGYLVRAHLLFPSYTFSGIALHTAIGQMLLAFALRSSVVRFDHSQARMFQREDDQIAFAGATILVGVAFGAGILCFAMLEGRVQTIVAGTVSTALSQRARSIEQSIGSHELNARNAAFRPSLIRSLREIDQGRNNASNAANVRAITDGLIGLGFSGLSYYDVQGNVVASGGTFVQSPDLTVRLASLSNADLLWGDGLVIHHRIKLQDDAGIVGTLVSEQPLTEITALVQAASELGASGETRLCAAQSENLIKCFPSRFNPAVDSRPQIDALGQRVPISRALRGEQGVLTTRDYRDQNVIAAFAPVGKLGLGLVVKVDTAEIFMPIREQLETAVVLLFVFVAAGTLLLRARVRPLAKTLLQRTEEVEERTRALQKSNVELQTAMRQLVESEKLAALGSIVAGVAHELNTPLGNILLVSSTLQNHVEEFAAAHHKGALRKSSVDQFVAEVTNAAGLITMSSQRAARLVSQFKGVAIDQASNRRVRFDLAQTLDAVVESLKPSLKQSRVEIVQDVESGIMLDSFPGALEQIVINIVMNAVTHAFPDGRVGTITLAARRPSDGAVRLTISDDGCGMAPDVAPHIFEPFFTTKLGHGGNGLGLYIVHNLLTGLLGGAVTVDSGPSRGTAFHIDVPLVALQLVADSTSAARAGSSGAASNG